VHATEPILLNGQTSDVIMTWENIFSCRTVNIWNSIQSEVVKAPSLNSFKNRFDRFWMNQDIIIYSWHAELTRTDSSSIVGLKFTHTINSPVIFRTNEQDVANLLVTCRQLATRKLANKSAMKLWGSSLRHEEVTRNWSQWNLSGTAYTAVPFSCCRQILWKST